MKQARSIQLFKTSLFIILLSAAAIGFSPVSAQTTPNPAADSARPLYPFGPYKTQLKINSKTGQKVNCDATSSSSPAQIKEEIKTKFGIDFQGLWTSAYLANACSKFAEVSGTRFFDLLHYNKPYEQSIFPVINTSCAGSRVSSDRTVYTGDCGNQTVNMAVLIHEIGHVLYWVNLQHANMVLAARSQDRGKPYPKGGATRYGDDPESCASGGGGEIKEDFAESTTYYLNPGANEQTVGAAHCKSSRVPFADHSSAHYQMMNQILGDFNQWKLKEF